MLDILTPRFPYDLPAAVLGYLLDALLVHVVVAVLALQALLEEAPQQLAAVAAHGGPRVRVQHERVRDVDGRLRLPARPAAAQRRGAVLFGSRDYYSLQEYGYRFISMKHNQRVFIRGSSRRSTDDYLMLRKPSLILMLDFS